MGWRELAASLFASLVSLGWPVAVVVLVLVLIRKFQAEFAELLGRLTKAKVPGADLDFVARVGEVEESAEQVVVEEEIPESASRPRSPTTEPVAAMILTYESLARQIVDLHDAAFPSETTSDRKIPPVVALRKVYRAGLISSDAIEVINNLRSIRGDVAHSRVVVDAVTATQFVEAVDDMSRYVAEQARKVRAGMLAAALN
jgi:hypothetical protein